MGQFRVHSQLYPVIELLPQLVKSDNKAVNGAGSAVLILVYLLELRIVTKASRGGSGLLTVDGGLLSDAALDFAEPL